MWTKEKIQAFLRQENLPYRQRIALPYELSVPGKDRKSVSELIFQSDMAGKSVLVIGSCLGYFCLEAAERGAFRVVGWEIDPDRLRQARMIAEMKGLPVEYVQRDIEVTEPEEDFDLVLCLNVLQHMFDPIGVLETLIAHTRGELILEIVSPKSSELGLSWVKRFVISKIPAVIVGQGSSALHHNKQKQKKYFFTKKALIHILQYHRNYFGKLDIYEADFKDRFLVIAHKRRIKHLIVVAGPVASGKTTLIHKLISHEYPKLTEKLGVKSFDGWDIRELDDLYDYQKVTLDGLFFHYNCLRVYRRGPRSYSRDEALHILKTAEKISFVTVYTEPEQLRRQLAGRRKLERQSLRSRVELGYLSATRHLIKLTFQKILGLPGIRVTESLPFFKRSFRKVFQEASKGDFKILKVYQNIEHVLNLYREWFDYIDQLDLNVRHNLVVTINKQLSIYSRTEWEQKIRLSYED